MAKAFDDDTNQVLRRLANEVMAERFGGRQNQLAKALGVSAGYVSDFLAGNRGAGLEMMKGLGRTAPLEFLGMLGIDLDVVVLLLEGKTSSVGAQMNLLPDVVRRAARAAIELTGCTPGDACVAAMDAFEEHGALPGTNADWWLTQIRDRIPKRAQSGERPSAKLRLAAKSQE